MGEYADRKNCTLFRWTAPEGIYCKGTCVRAQTASLDEPTAIIDAKGQADFIQLLKSLIMRSPYFL
jgi:hypothetical protein